MSAYFGVKTHFDMYSNLQKECVNSDERLMEGQTDGHTEGFPALNFKYLSKVIDPLVHILTKAALLMKR